MHISVAAQNAAASAVGALANGGTLLIYTGAMPATPATAASGTLLGTLTLSATAFGAPSAGTITAAAITGATAVASGTAGYFRVLSSGSVAEIDGTISASGGGGELILSTTSIVSGATIDVSSWTITMPAA